MTRGRDRPGIVAVQVRAFVSETKIQKRTILATGGGRMPRKQVRQVRLSPARKPGAGKAPANPLAVALRAFDQAAAGLGLPVQDRLKLLNMGRSKYFSARLQNDPALDVDRRDRLGYFLAAYELSGRLVGNPGAWLKASNSAPLFAGRTPLECMLSGRMEDLISTVHYLKGMYGGWA